tara:strand:+ start:351 stop:554 length:204 start_codon:yes stop_codon:yes gene_type:complete
MGHEERNKMKTYIVDIKGVVIDADDWDNTTVHINRNGEWCEIPFDKDDIVETKIDELDYDAVLKGHR